MNKHFNQYLNIDDKTLKIVKRLIHKGYFTQRFTQRFQMLISLNEQLSKIYNIKKLPIKIIPYKKVRYDDDNDNFIEVGDCLSLVSFLAKFKLHLDHNKTSIDNKEVKSNRDCFDWSLSVIKFSDEVIISKIIKSIEKSMLKETVTT